MSYKNIILVLLSLSLFFIGPVVADEEHIYFEGYNLSEKKYDPIEFSEKLQWQDSIEAKGYIIKVEDFAPRDKAFITISKNGTLLKNGLLRYTNKYGSNDDYESITYTDWDKKEQIKVIGTNIDAKTYNWSGDVIADPTATIDVEYRNISILGTPELNMVIHTDREEYDPRLDFESEIDLDIEIYNDGDTRAEDVKVNLNTSGMEVIEGDLDINISSLEKDDMVEKSATLKVPHYWEENELQISANAEYYDIFDDIHQKNASKDIEIAPANELIVKKTIVGQKSYVKPLNRTFDDRICNNTSYYIKHEKYLKDGSEKSIGNIDMDESARFAVTIRNDGIYEINNIEIEDKLPNSMQSYDDLILKKNVSLEAGEQIDVFSYRLRPTDTGSYDLPVAVASFTTPNNVTYTKESINNIDNIEINGPIIELEQNADKSKITTSDEVNITVNIMNKGTRPAYVNVASKIPFDATLIRGNKSFTALAKEKETMSYSYTISFKEGGTYEIPPANAIFVDIRDYKGERISNKLTFDVTGPSVQSSEDNNEITPSNEDTNESNLTEDHEDTNESDYDLFTLAFYGIGSLIFFVLMVKGFT